MERICILRYDNERSKGHHKHFREKESEIKFTSIEELLKTFLAEVEKIRRSENESQEYND